MRGSRVDAVLVNPASRAAVYQSLASELAAIEPPVWAGLIARFLLKRGRSVEILDAGALGLSHADTARRVAEAKPKLAVIVVYGQQPSASTQNMPACGETARALKEIAPEIPVGMVGGHVSSLPERTMKEEETDFVCQGEGPHTILDLLELLGSGRREGFEKVPGLWYRQDGRILSTPQAPLIQDMDTDLGGCAWELFPMDRYRAHNWHCFDRIHERAPYASVYTTLGCPFRCSFCCINAPFGGPSYRKRSPANVADELELLHRKYGVKNVKIADELFVLYTPYVEGVCDEIIRRGLDLNIWAYARVDTVKPRVLEKLKRAGIHWLALGIESASEYVRDGVDKKVRQEDIRDTVKQIQNAGIHIIGNYIFGLPDDTHESMQQTLDMALDLKCEFANFYSAMAYPGSRLYAIALEKGWKLPDSWSGYSQHAEDALPLPTDHLSAGEVLAFRDRAFRIHFTDPGYLAYVEKTFGVDTRRHVQEMTRHTLKRRFAAAS